jgi:hypothetical protein
MREIKFNAWNKESKTMHYDILSKENFSYSFLDFDTYIWLQYTGVKDKNGKEIYDRYIINFPDNKYYQKSFVEFGNLGFQISIKDGFCNDFDADQWENFEVIGNIYENPELLSE